MEKLLMKNQDKTSNQRGLPVTTVGGAATAITGETVQLKYYNSGVLTTDAGQAAGTLVVGKFAKGKILNAIGDVIATPNDTSVAFTCNAFTSEQTIDYKQAEMGDCETGVQKLARLTKDYTNGQYCIDYRTGTVYGKKATTATQMTSTSYSHATETLSFSGGDIEIGAVEIKDATADTRASVIAANTAAVPYWQGAMPARYMATPPTLTDTYASPLLLDVDGQLKVAGSFSASVPTTLTGGTKAVTTHGTAVALGTTLATKSIYIRALDANVGSVNVGDASVDYSTNPEVTLYPGDALVIEIADRATVFVDATNDGDGVSYLAQS
jgi:hypothetical protein